MDVEEQRDDQRWIGPCGDRAQHRVDDGRRVEPFDDSQRFREPLADLGFAKRTCQQRHRFRFGSYIRCVFEHGERYGEIGTGERFPQLRGRTERGECFHVPPVLRAAPREQVFDSGSLGGVGVVDDVDVIADAIVPFVVVNLHTRLKPLHGGRDEPAQ